MQIEDSDAMTIQVKYLSESEIERDAEALLADYEETTSERLKLPVPVDEIATYHLALQLGFADLHEIFGVPMLRGQPDILGAIWIEDEKVLIDQSLNPKWNPPMLGRYRFSVGHEIGHWRLHRKYVNTNVNQESLLDDASEPTVICRSSEAKDPIEWQADYHSSCLLMPRHEIYRAWRERFGSDDPFIYEVMRTSMQIRPSRWTRPQRIGGIIEGQGYIDFAEGWAQCFTSIFDVSRQAMRIRLENLGLLCREVPRQSRLAGFK